MTGSQKRAVETYRARLGQRGLARFEVLGRPDDCDLLRTLARRLAEDTPEADRLRGAVMGSLGTLPRKGGVLAALRRSPLVGAELDLTRTVEPGRSVDL